MITLGYIEELNPTNSNMFRVRIPIFEQAGNPDRAILTANLCYNPGNLNAYRIGDCVVVGFLEDRLGKAIILGKLFTGEEETATNFSNANSLTVSESAKLPGNTTIGDLSFLDLSNLTERVNNLQTQVDTIMGKIDLE